MSDSKIYSLYFPEEVIKSISKKTPSLTLKELLMELVACCPIKAVSEELRPSLINLKNYFYKMTQSEMAQLSDIDLIASDVLERKRKYKKLLIEKIEKI